LQLCFVKLPDTNLVVDRSSVTFFASGNDAQDTVSEHTEPCPRLKSPELSAFPLRRGPLVFLLQG
jgi:hypothetical protein